MNPTRIISYPHMGDYHIPIRTFFERLYPDAEVRPAPPITKHTAALGARHSPDFICEPFKYNMGNFIEALDDGANTLFQTGTGCRYGYYGELQEQILRDLDYEFDFVRLNRENARPRRAYRKLRALGSPLNAAQMAGAALDAIEDIRRMDRQAHHRRQHPESQADPPLNVGIVGDLYTVMEPFANCDLERRLAARGVAVSREMSVTFLLFPPSNRRRLRDAGGYLRRHVGANGLDSVAQSLRYAKAGYDGIIHIKSFGCTPELNAVPALMCVSHDHGIPILHLSFDTHQSSAGLETRLEAFLDMITMRRQAQHES
ncbi:MAG: hypothetical protein FWE08_05960 [Oscillospiraceae bacterium]|nr:hypothetical protein [Oscillospiraceae bacterium]